MKKFMKCGRCGNAKDFTTHEFRPKQWIAYCDECGCEATERTQDRVIDQWNANHGMPERKSKKATKKQSLTERMSEKMSLSSMLHAERVSEYSPFEEPVDFTTSTTKSDEPF